MSRTIPSDRRVLSCREADRQFRQQHGTASAAVRAGLLPARRKGRAILVSAKRAEELWGAHA